MIRRRWLQVSLRTLLVLLTAICIWLGWQVERARKQREAINAIAERGGGTSYVWEIEPKDGMGRSTKPACPLPDWIRQLFGDDLLFPVSTVWLGPNFTDDDLSIIQSFDSSRLLALNLSGSKITDSGLARLPRMARLRTMGLDNTSITDDGLRHLAKFPNLTYLQMLDVKISDAGLLNLQSNKRLEVIMSRQSEFTRAGVAQFKESVPRCKVDVWPYVIRSMTLD
jgi:hypothetical protein